MKRSKSDLFSSPSGQRSIQILAGFGILYVFTVTLELPLVFHDASSRSSPLPTDEEFEEKQAPVRPLKIPLKKALNQSSDTNPERRVSEFKPLSGMTFDVTGVNSSSKDGFSGIQKLAKEAFEAGTMLWKELESGRAPGVRRNATEENRNESCPYSILISGSRFSEKGQVLVLPCGLKEGSQITIAGSPRQGHVEERKNAKVMVSQFVVELQGLKAVDGEDPPRMLHFNPRLKGDGSGRAVIEQNTRYRMQWGTSVRCAGRKSKADEETVDGQAKCEEWIHSDDHPEESKALQWFNQLIGLTKKQTADWAYPFAEGKLFVLTLRAGLEGYHVEVGGRHVTSFPHRAGFTLEDATGLSVKGDIDVHSIYAASLPTLHTSQKPLDISIRWKAQHLPDGPVKLFIGIISAGNHFAERMGVRRSWMQHRLIKSSVVVVRFFVALVGEDTKVVFESWIRGGIYGGKGEGKGKDKKDN